MNINTRQLFVLSTLAGTVLTTSIPVYATTAKDQTLVITGHKPVAAPELTLGDTLTLEPRFSDPDGDTEDTSPSGTTYQWQVETSPGQWEDIPGQTTTQYTPSSTNKGHVLRAQVTARTDSNNTIPFEGDAIASGSVDTYSVISSTKSSLPDCVGLADTDIKCSVTLINSLGEPVSNAIVDIKPGYSAKTTSGTTDSSGQTTVIVHPDKVVDAAEDKEAESVITVNNVEVLPRIKVKVTPIVELYDKISNKARDWSGLIAHGAYLPINSTVGFASANGKKLDSHRWKVEGVTPAGEQKIVLDATNTEIQITDKPGVGMEGSMKFTDTMTGIVQMSQSFRFMSYVKFSNVIVSPYAGIENVCINSAEAKALGSNDGLARNDLFNWDYDGLHEGALWAGISYLPNTLDGAYRYGGTGRYSWVHIIQGVYADSPLKQTSSVPSPTDVLCR
ncbi:hypothetical protein [Escherichia sp. E4736]|uniref:hypothetical protein n=1 Tax=Escherichia sp. E4736 TaxID=2044466 RepID=UPI001080EB50|nr:hypothetical protein [Escherichia sp. E4736]TGB62314.1 hypothetical protein CQB02_23375 [Escherichia coli]TLI87770.1 hypothetical protein FEK46_23085 [Escherichia sp. E4736]